MKQRKIKAVAQPLAKEQVLYLVLFLTLLYTSKRMRLMQPKSNMATLLINQKHQKLQAAIQDKRLKASMD